MIDIHLVANPLSNFSTSFCSSALFSSICDIIIVLCTNCPQSFSFYRASLFRAGLPDIFFSRVQMVRDVSEHTRVPRHDVRQFKFLWWPLWCTSSLLILDRGTRVGNCNAMHFAKVPGILIAAKLYLPRCIGNVTGQGAGKLASLPIHVIAW